MEPASVKSMYDALVHNAVPSDNRKLWKLKIPLKVKIFLWFLNKGVILTRDNLARRNWQGCKKMCFLNPSNTYFLIANLPDRDGQ